MSSRRIVVLIDRYLPILGGAQQNVHLVMTRLVRRGYKVSVLSRRIAEKLSAQETIDGITVRRLGFHRNRLISKVLCLIQVTRYLKKRSNEYDLVLAVPCTYYTDLLPAYLAYRSTGRPYVVRTTGLESIDFMFRWPGVSLGEKIWKLFIPAFVWRRLAKEMAVVIVQTPATMQTAIKWGLDNSILIFNSVDLHRFKPADTQTRTGLRRRLGIPHDHFVVINTGRYIRGKNQETLIGAIEKIVEQRGHNSVYCLILGATERGNISDTESQLKQLVKTRGLESNVRFVDDAINVEDYLRASDMFAFPTFYSWEGMPNSLLEAMACGLAIVASDIPQISSFLPPAAGRLVPPLETSAFAREITMLMDDHEGLQQLGSAAAEFARASFDAELIADKYEKLIEQALAT